MSLKIKQVIAAHDALSLLIAKDQENKFVFPSAVRIKFALNLRKVKDVVKDFYTEYNALVKTHGEEQPKDPNAPPGAEPVWKVVDPVKMEVFNKERTDLLESDTDIQLSPIDYKQLGENQLPIDLILVLIETGLVVE